MRPLLALGFLIVLVGCSKPTPVTGVVTLDDRPLPDAYVTFIPDGATEGLGGHGRTNADGKYSLQPSRGNSLDPGAYRVTVRRPLNPDGSPGDPNIPEMDSPAKESLAPEYSQPAQTTLRVDVSDQHRVHDFKLKSAAAP